MEYETFKAQWLDAMNRAAKYSTGQVGYSINVEKVAELADAYPEFEDRLEDELEAAHYGAKAAA